MKAGASLRIATAFLIPLLLQGCSSKSLDIESALDEMESKCDQAAILLREFTNATSTAQIKSAIVALRECDECKLQLGALYKEEMSIGQKRRFMNYLTKQQGDAIGLMNQLLEKRQNQLAEDPMIRAATRGPAKAVQENK